MLEKLITNFKNSLPEFIRKKMGGTVELEVKASDNIIANENIESPSTDQADQKKKQTSMIIRVVVILILGYLALDEFVLKKGKDEPTAEEMLTSAPKRKKRKVVKPLEKPAETTTAGPTTTTSSTEAPVEAEVAKGPTDAITSSEVPVTEPTSDEAPPIENINVLDKDDPSIASQTTTSETPTEVVETKIMGNTIDNTIDKKIDQLIGNEAQTNLPIEEIKIPSQSKNQGELVSDSINEPSKESSMASKIVEEITETPAPSYDQVGRGLVYNCKDKYWACLDRPAYVICNNNMKWNKSKGNSMECVVQSVYNSDEDCAKVQKYNVSTSQATGFCQN